MGVLMVRLVIAAIAVMPSIVIAQNGQVGEYSPAHVLIIRHAEKPPDSDTSLDLAPAGFARAKALPQLFVTSQQRRDPLPEPDFIFAASDTKHSRRSAETASPLGAALQLKVDTHYADNQARSLARALLSKKKYDGKTILIVWHQGTIPKLAKALGAKDAPSGWKDSVFDRVWEIDYSGYGTISFHNRPQHLMPGDSSR